MSKSTSGHSTHAIALDISRLHPYAAFQLYECDPSVVPDLTALAGDVAKQLDKSGPNNIGTAVVAQSKLPSQAGANSVAIHFRKTAQAAWTDDATVQDVEQHIVVLICHGTILGMSSSATEVRKRINDYLCEQPNLTAMAPDVLENALLRSVQLRTLWLSGVHRRSPFKADSKVLTGPQLQTALNPLDDRTFRPSSARADTGLPANSGVARVGVSPERSYAWIGPTPDVSAFINRFVCLTTHISTRHAMKRHSPLPILAQALPKAPHAGSVRNAFDFSFIALETATDLDEKTKRILETFEAELAFATTGSAANQDFTLLVSDRNQRNTNRIAGDWKIDVKVDLSRATATADLAADSKGWTHWEAFGRLLRNGSMWSVWYETGHSLGSREWTMLDARASNYEGTITSVNFGAGGWNIEIEKPLVPRGRAVAWPQIGGDASLFSWWVKDGMASCFPNFNSATDPNSFAFCICDDGSNELADFVVMAKHQCFATASNPSSLAFIMVHLKASSTSNATRGMAPKQYEEVLGQATKNLGRVYFPDTRDYLLARLGRGVAMLWEWTANRFNVICTRGARLPRSAPVRATLSAFNGQRFHFHVVVVQPHQGKANFDVAMNTSPVDFKTHMLCTLLCAADGAARASTANLTVVTSP